MVRSRTGAVGGTTVGQACGAVPLCSVTAGPDAGRCRSTRLAPAGTAMPVWPLVTACETPFTTRANEPPVAEPSLSAPRSTVAPVAVQCVVNAPAAGVTTGGGQASGAVALLATCESPA